MRAVAIPVVQHPAWIEVDLVQLAHNLCILKEMAAPARLALAVKANAYGHGLVEVGQCAQRAGIDRLCIAHWQEALALREAGIEVPILLLGAVAEQTMESLIELDVELSVSSARKAELLQQVCQRLGRHVRVHLEVDTGMRRTGMRPETSMALLERWHDFPNLFPIGIYTHFATADMPDHPAFEQQWAAFQLVLSSPLVHQAGLLRHCANSAAFLRSPETHGDLVRLGLLAYGYHPCGASLPYGIAPCLEWKARVSFTKTVRAGEGISYGHRYRPESDSRIVTVPWGYGDGYPRTLSAEGSVLIRGRRFPIVGSICMDQFMVDVGSTPVQVGEEVVLLGRQGEETLSAQELADLSGTIAWDILCRGSPRLLRLYRSTLNLCSSLSGACP